MNKVVIKTKSTESRNNIFDLLTDGLKSKCSNVCGFYNVDKRYKNRNGINGIGVFCDKITIYGD